MREIDPKPYRDFYIDIQWKRSAYTVYREAVGEIYQKPQAARGLIITRSQHDA